MKTVAQLIKELESFPHDAYVASYSKEDTGIVVYPASFASYGLWDRRSSDTDEPLGFVQLYYDNMLEKRPDK